MTYLSIVVFSLFMKLFGSIRTLKFVLFIQLVRDKTYMVLTSCV
jgi:hypothetical protein